MAQRRAVHDLSAAALRFAPAIVPFVLAVVLFAPATLGGRVLSASDLPLFSAPFLGQPPGVERENVLQFDSAYVFEPDGLLVREALREGRLPIWAPALSAGRPLLAAQQSAPLFPLTWIGVAFPYWESLAWIAVLKLTLAGLGTVLLARTLGLGLGAALIAAIAFGFSSYLVDWLMHPHINAYVLLPWLLLLADRLRRTGTVRDAAILGGVLGLAYLGGQPESSFIVSLAAACWLLYRLVATRPTRREGLRTVVLAGAAVALGVALAAVMILPFVEALREAYSTSRAGDPLPFRSGLSAFFPEFWGRPDRAAAPGGPSNFTERTFYVGVLPTMLAVAGLVVRRPRGPQLFFLGLALASVVIALNTGSVTDVLRDLPGLAEMNLNRLLVLLSFGIAMLAAFGWERFMGGAPGERRRMLIAAAAVGLLPAVVEIGAHPSWLGDLELGVKRMLARDTPLTPDLIAFASVLRWIVFAGLTLAVLAGLTLWRQRSTVLAAAGVGVVALDLLVMGWGYNPAISKDEAAPPTPPAVNAMRRLTAAGGRVAGFESLEPNTASRWGLRDARGHEQPVVERTERLWYALGGGNDGATAALAPLSPDLPKLLDVFGVRAVLFNPSALRDGRLDVAPALRGAPIAYSSDDGVVVEHRSALPPAFVAYDWHPSAGLVESLFGVAGATSQEARDQPIIETEERPAGPAMPATPARVVSRSDTSVTLVVRARARGQLVLLDSFYPGWRAEVDGRNTEIRPANAAFRAVPVGPGLHEVRFSYRPTSVIAGGAISLVALVILVAACVIRRKPSARRGSRIERRDDPLN